MASKKASAPSPCETADRLGERARGQRTGRDDHVVPVARGKSGDFATLEGDKRMSQHRLLDRRGETVPVDGKSAAGRHLMGVGAAHDDRTERPHLAMEDADCVGRRVVGAKRVGADELGQPARPVSGRRGQRAHLMQHDGNAGLGRLPRRLRSGEAAADNVDGTHGVSWRSAERTSTLGGEQKAAPEGAAFSPAARGGALSLDLGAYAAA